jgi:signal transduction histidine kinase
MPKTTTSILVSPNLFRTKAPHETTGFFNSLLGLGLYIVREVARAHGGEVDVRFGEGETVFGVRLPRRNQGLSP